MNKKLDEDIWIIRGRLFPPTLIGKVGYGGDEDGPSYYRDYTNLDVEAELNSAKKYIENQFYSKEEFLYVLEGLEKRAKTYFETDYSKHISVYAKHDGKYYTGIKEDGEFIINEALNNEYKNIIVLKKEKLKLLYEKLIGELSEKYNALSKTLTNEDTASPKNEPLKLLEIINSYFENITGVITLMDFFIGDAPNKYSWFQSKFKEVTFQIDTNEICQQIESNLLLNSIEYNEKLFNIITNKIERIEKLILEMGLKESYNKLKAEKFDSCVTFVGKTRGMRLLSMVGGKDTHQQYHEVYPSLESFYKSILELFNEGKNRINDLFSLRKLNISEVALSSLLSKDTPVPPQNNPHEDISLISEKHTLNSESISDYLYNLAKNNPSELDMYNYIEKATDGFDIFKLKLLLKDVEFNIFNLFEEKTPDYKEQQLRIEAWKKKNKEIPYKTIPALIHKGKKAWEESKILDIHKLFPEIDIELYPLYQFRNYVTTLITQGKPNTHPSDTTPSNAEKTNSKKEAKISLPAIALKYRYLHITGEHEGITLENRDEIALKHKWTAQSSGRKLDSYYKKYQSEADRTNPTILSDEAGYYQSKNKRIEHIKQAVQELATHPKALEISKKELEKASK